MNVSRLLQLLVLLFAVISCSEKHEPADLVFEGGRIYTVDDAQPVVEAVAVRSNRILFAGSATEVRDYISEKTRVIDLEEKIMTPGFIEGHGHIMGVGYGEVELDLAGVKSYAELVDEVEQAVAKAAPGEWIVGRGNRPCAPIRSMQHSAPFRKMYLARSKRENWLTSPYFQQILCPLRTVKFWKAKS